MYMLISKQVHANMLAVLTVASITLALIFRVAKVNIEIQLLDMRFSFKDAYFSIVYNIEK